jgi:YD repeat-containing protein
VHQRHKQCCLLGRYELLTSVNQSTQTRTFAYDSIKRLASAINPESGTVGYLHDFNGNLTQKTDARGIVTQYGYDGLNRVISRAYQNDGGVTPNVSYYYDSIVPAGAPTGFNRGVSLGRLVASTYGGDLPAHTRDTI